MITRQFRYNGEARNVGRFGLVRAGQIVTLTFKEAMSVSNNPLFVPVEEAQVNELKETGGQVEGETEVEKEPIAPVAVDEVADVPAPKVAEAVVEEKQFGSKKRRR